MILDFTQTIIAAAVASKPTPEACFMQTPTQAKTYQAIVLSSKDPDIAQHAEVTVTGFVATVPEIVRRGHSGERCVNENTITSFDFGDLLIPGLQKPTEAQLAALHKSTKLTPPMWAELLGWAVLDWDGWNDMERDLTVPCTRLEFEDRVVKCTCKRFPGIEPRREETVMGYSEALVNIPDAAPETPTAPPVAEKRAKLPDTRASVTHKFDIGGQKGFVTVGYYPDENGDGDPQRPGELFITIQKQGSTLQGFADAWARSVSMLLQYGVPVSEIARMFAWHKFEPRGYTTNADIPRADSIVDYIARWLGYLCIEGYNPGNGQAHELGVVGQGEPEN